MRKFEFTAVAAGLIGGAMLLFGTAPASAATLPSPAFAATGATATVEYVDTRRYDSNRYGYRYDRNRHGYRYTHARRGYRHYYGGYFYASPWWLAPTLSFGLVMPQYAPQYAPQYSGQSSGHVQWCHNRFRSYNAATDSYLGYDGQYHRCNSPYR
jgi:hypothetical protein